LARVANADAHDLATAIEIHANGLGNFAADGSDALGKLGRSDAIAR
jgi:hypothetical protein